MSQLANRVTPSISKPAIPPLQNGDRLNRHEFERRYDATPGLKKAELIEGRVYVSPPVSYGGHSSPHFDLIGLFFVYRMATPGVLGGDNGTIRLDAENMPQPDGFLMIQPASGGQAKIDPDDYVTGPPELIAEIAASSASYDLHDKLDLYCRYGVREFIVWRTLDGELDYFILRQGKYERLAPGTDNFWRSELFPGLWFDGAAIISGDLTVALARLQQGIASPEHQTFVAALQQRAAASASAK
jgi:Uma2 family endonuclease